MSKLSSTFLDFSFLLPHGYNFNEKVLKNLKNSLVKVKYQTSNSNECCDLACQVIGGRKNQSFDDNFTEMFKTIGHPNIVEIHSIFQRKNLLFLFMEWIEDGNLLQYIQAKGFLGENHAKRLLFQIIQGLKYLHDLKIAHCNLSCTSIMLKGNCVKISGLKYLKDCTSKKYCDAGSKKTLEIFYRSPEINRVEQYDPIIADVYSLGVILFIMLNASFPYNCCNIKELLVDQERRRFSIRASNFHKLSINCQVAIQILLEPNQHLRWNCQTILSLDWLK